MITAVSTGSTMIDSFGTVVVVVFAIDALASIAADVAIGSKNSLSLRGDDLVARPFFFGKGATLMAVRFLLCSSSVLA